MIIKRISPLVQAIIVVGLVLLLGVIGWYGGPTQTVPLGMGSPAIDQAVSAACPALDQRGYERQSACDIGPFEYHELVLGLKKGSIYLSFWEIDKTGQLPCAMLGVSIYSFIGIGCTRGTIFALYV